MAKSLLICLLCALGVVRARAQTDFEDPYRFWKWPAEDARALVDGLASPRILYAVGTAGALLLVARHDAQVTEDLSSFSPQPADLLVRVVEEFGNVTAVRPVAGAIFIGTLFSADQKLQDAAFTSFEAVIVSNLLTNGLKSVVGRARPWQEEGALTFKPFSGNTSFPSGHSTIAFAFVTPWLLYYPNAFTPGLIVLGAGTAFSRMITNNHWFTDVVGGSAVGFFTAYFLYQRHRHNSRRVLIAPTVAADQLGLSISVKFD